MSGRCVFGLIADAYLPIERVTMSTSSQTLACLPSVCFEESERWETASRCLALAGDSRAMRRLRVHSVAYRPLDRAAGLVAPLNLAYRRGENSAAAQRFIALVRRTVS